MTTPSGAVRPMSWPIEDELYVRAAWERTWKDINRCFAGSENPSRRPDKLKAVRAECSAWFGTLSLTKAIIDGFWMLPELLPSAN